MSSYENILVDQVVLRSISRVDSLLQITHALMLLSRRFYKYITRHECIWQEILSTSRFTLPLQVCQNVHLSLVHFRTCFADQLGVIDEHTCLRHIHTIPIVDRHVLENGGAYRTLSTYFGDDSDSISLQSKTETSDSFAGFLVLARQFKKLCHNYHNPGRALGSTGLYDFRSKSTKLAHCEAE